MNIVHEGIFANDVLTRVGTQNKYTLFSYIAAPLYTFLSPWAATSLVFIAGQLVWFSGVIALVAKFAEDEKVAFFGLLAAFLLPATYFGFSVLSYGESFATPRLFVEGLTFWSLWCFFTRNYLISALLVLAAFSLHPIMGLIAASLLIAILLQTGRRWWWIFGGASVAGAAVIFASGAVPLEHLTATLEGDWLQAVQARARYLYVSEWRAKDWARTILEASILLPLLALYSGWQRRLIVAAAVVGASGLLVSFIGTDVLHNVLLSQIQTSRGVWFAYLLGNVGLGVVVASLYRKSEEDGDAFLFLYISAWVIVQLLWPLPGMVLGLVASGLAYLRIIGKIAGIPSLFRRLIYMLSMMLLVWLLFLRLKFWLAPGNLAAAFEKSEAFVGIAGFTQVELVGVAFIIFAAVRLRLKVSAPVAKGLLVLLTLWSIFVWDRRSADDRGLEGDYFVEQLLEQIPEGAQVYWEGNIKGAWFLLGRPSYFDNIQGAGVVFSEPLAAEYLRRSRIMQALDGVDYINIWRPFKTREEYVERLTARKKIDQGDLVDACANAPELDFLMLTRRVEGAYLMEWQPRTHDQVARQALTGPDPNPAAPLFLYRCADFR